jgi:hypothetical protein
MPTWQQQQKFPGHSLRAGLATAAETDDASPEMTRRYQRPARALPRQPHASTEETLNVSRQAHEGSSIDEWVLSLLG